jgi:predicted AlkP superfamily phosphohydrolase/phosphomutase
LSAKNIDWKETLAYSYGNIGQIYLNIEGREPQGIIRPEEADIYTEEIISKLNKLKNPYNKERVIEKALRKEEIYHGDLLKQAPEILVTFREGYMASGASEFISDRVISPTFAGSGWHRMNGILIGNGVNLANKKLEPDQEIKLIDLLPTILYSMKLPIPKGLDGRVASEIFSESFLKENEILYRDEDMEEVKERNFIYDQEQIKQRLKGLGYI